MSRPLPHPLDWIDDELSNLEQHSLRRVLRARNGAQGPTFSIDRRETLNFGSNDYLALAADPRVCSAAQAALAAEGVGGGASPLLAGRSQSHVELESELARFENVEAALVFPSGFAANLGVLPALAGRGDAIFADELNHASLIDGCRLSRADVTVYPHNDWRRLDQMLAEHSGAGRRWIVTDTLFSMDGDLAPLCELADVAERRGCGLVVDEAHATGVLGDNGRGAAELFGVEDRVHVRIGTLSKALGAAGGFVAGERRLVDWLANRARPYVFSTAPSPAVCAAAIAALRIVVDEPQRRRELSARADRLRERLRTEGWDVGQSTTQVIPLLVGDPERALELAAQLWRQGIYAPAIRPPSVPSGASRIRITLSYGHTDGMIDRLVTTLGKLAPQAIGR